MGGTKLDPPPFRGDDTSDLVVILFFLFVLFPSRSGSGPGRLAVVTECVETQ